MTKRHDSIASLFLTQMVGLQADTHADVKTAEFIRQLAANGEMGIDVFDAKLGLNSAIMRISNEDGNYADQVLTDLAAAGAALDAQIANFEAQIAQARESGLYRGTPQPADSFAAQPGEQLGADPLVDTRQPGDKPDAAAIAGRHTGGGDLRDGRLHDAAD